MRLRRGEAERATGESSLVALGVSAWTWLKTKCSRLPLPIVTYSVAEGVSISTITFAVLSSMNEIELAEIGRSVSVEFDLGRFVDWESIGSARRGNGSLTTDRGSYILKRRENQESVQLYAEVEVLLNSSGVRQARIFRKPSGGLITKEGYAVYERLEGSTSTTLSTAQLESTIAYMVKYNAALAEMPIPAHVVALDDPWKRAISPEYLIEDRPSQMDALRLSSCPRQVAERCLGFLSSEIQVYRDLPLQLVHSDIGPGNILFDGDEVVAIIDFSPHAAPELYSLCAFFYWQLLWFNGFELNVERVLRSLELYAAKRRGFSVGAGELRYLFVLAAAFRLFGAAMAMADGLATYSEGSMDRRREMVEKVLSDESLEFETG